MMRPYSHSNRRTQPGLHSWLVLVMLLLAGSLLPAQISNGGTVVGTVVDSTGAVVQGASVTLIDTQTKSKRATSSNGTGAYVFTNVPPSTYDIVVTKSGFATVRVESLVVAVGTQSTANAKLPVGNEQQTIEVTGEGTQLQTLSATVGDVVSPEALQALPSLLHDVGTFTELQPGVSPDGSVAGAVVDQSTFMLDGGNNSNDMDGSMSVYTSTFAGDPTGGAGGQNGNTAAGPTGVLPTPQDSVEEYKVNTANQTADFNSSAGAQVEIVTKRGTDKIHGTVYEYYLDNDFSANNWENNNPNAYSKVADYHYSKFGASLGGPLVPVHIWGGKTYLFGMYQGWRYPKSEIYEHAVPSANLRNGIVTFNGTDYDLKTIDPRGIGLNPIVSGVWSANMPTGNDTSCGSLLGTRCDGVNEIGYKSQLNIPIKDNFLVFRIDHDFGEKWHFMASYRYYKLEDTTDSQVDIGGFFTGDKLGTPAALSKRPQQPSYLVASLTTQITQALSNDFHFSFLRNFWQWSDGGAPAQATGLGGAIEPMGEVSTTSLIPFNVNTQSIRTRFWDGHDTFLRDDLTLLKGKHMFQFGGQFQRNWDYHQRTDNGGGINNTITYQLGDSKGAGSVDLSSLGGNYPYSSSKAARVAAAALGIVTDSQVAYTRSGSNLTLNSIGSPAFDQSTIKFYNFYFNDTWRLTSNFTLTYGLGWTAEMPPTEAQGKQTVVVDDSDTPVTTQDYLAQRKSAALQGNVYNPELGFALVANVGKGLKYPYHPFYGSFSPRVAAAWNPHFDHDSIFGKLFGSEGTVIRGGYSHQYGRLNGVDLVLSPLLGVGLIQAVQCTTATNDGTCASSAATASTAFRIGTDGDSAPLPAASATLPQPVYPGYNAIAGAASEGMDPGFRPNTIDSFDITIQRQLGHGTIVEVGYIGRIIRHEYQPVNLNAVPYMMTKGGQQFQNAYASLEKALGCATSIGACGASVPSAYLSDGVTPNAAYATYVNNLASANPQAFLETAVATTYCNGTFSNGSGSSYANCTAAVLDNELSNLVNQAVWSLWSDLDNGNFNFAPTMMNTKTSNATYGGNGQASSGIALNASIGYGNYNGGFLTVKTSNWHGVTLQENFTYSKALGTGADVQATSEYTPNDPFDLRKMYGLQAFNRKFVFNTFVVWTEPFFNKQSGLLGRIAGGWQFAPIFTAGSGEPLACGTATGAQSFGSGDGNDYYDNEQCVFTSKYNSGNSAHYNVSGGTDSYGNSVGTQVVGSGSQAINMFKDPVKVWNQVRPPILGIDSRDSGLGPISGMPYWNMDVSVSKNIRLAERVSFEFSTIFTNVLNHNVLADPSLSLTSASTWGVLSSQINTPRSMEFGLRARF